MNVAQGALDTGSDVDVCIELWGVAGAQVWLELECGTDHRARAIGGLNNSGPSDADPCPCQPGLQLG